MKVVCVPFSGGGLGHGNGADKAPREIVKQLGEVFTNSHGITVEQIEVEESQHLASHKAIEEYCQTVDEKTVFLGGDHSITAPILRGLKRQLSFVCFDAHPDVVDNFTPATQEDYLRVLIDNSVVDPTQVFLIGIRNADSKELEYLQEKKVNVYFAQDVQDRGIKDIIEEILPMIKYPLYVSFDIDAIDPVEAIGTGYTEHGGLTSRESLFALHKLAPKVLFADIVEVNPKKDIHHITAKLAAQLLSELI